MIKSFLLFVIFVWLILHTVKLSAQTSISDSLVHERILYIQNNLILSKPAVDGWWYGWLGAYTAATMAQGTIALTSTDKNTRQDMALGAATTFLGAALQVLTPINTGRDAETLSKLSEITTDDQLRKLALAEELLKSNAMKEQAGRSWEIHALNESVNLASGLITWLGYKRTLWDGVTNFLMNSVITEAQIWTQPTRTLKDYQNYFRKYKSGSTSLSYQAQPEFFLSTFPGGASLKIVF
jgi:hypothetical protein